MIPLPKKKQIFVRLYEHDILPQVATSLMKILYESYSMERHWLLLDIAAKFASAN
jgi:hypothetical protein